MLRADTGVPLYRQLYNRLRDRIDDGKFELGQKLPSERTLAADHGISRLTVRKALGLLKDEGYVHAHHGKGYFVAPAIHDNRHQLAPASGAFIEAQAGARAQRRSGSSSPLSGQLLDRRVSNADGSLAARLHIRSGDAVIYMRWLRHKDGRPFALSDSYLPYRLSASILNADLTQRSYYEVLEQDMGIHVWRSQQEIQAVLANKEELELLNLSPPAALLLSHQVIFDEHNRPIEYARVLFTGDENTINLDTRRPR